MMKWSLKNEELMTLGLCLLVAVFVWIVGSIALKYFPHPHARNSFPIERRGRHASLKYHSLRTVVIIDPGHGGTDPGTLGVVNGHFVSEARYAYDVALRVRDLVKARGWVPVLTRYNDEMTGPDQASVNVILPFAGKNDCFTSDGKMVRSRVVGMKERLAIVSQTLKKYRWYHIVFVSIHFDNEPDKDMHGVHVIGPRDHLELASALETSFGREHRLRESHGAPYLPLMINGDKSHGVRNLYILDGENNPVRDRALIELGNFDNVHDLYSIRLPDTRQAEAALIVAGIAKFRCNSLCRKTLHPGVSAPG